MERIAVGGAKISEYLTLLVNGLCDGGDSTRYFLILFQCIDTNPPVVTQKINISLDPSDFPHQQTQRSVTHRYQVNRNSYRIGDTSAELIMQPKNSTSAGNSLLLLSASILLGRTSSMAVLAKSQ